MSFNKYKAIDITIFTIIYLVLELVVTKAATSWFPEQAFSVSLMLPILLILIMRWDYLAIIDIVLFPLFFVFISNKEATISQYLIYLIGSLSLIIPTILIKKIGKEKVVKKCLYSLIYIIGSYILVETFRGLAAMIFLKVNMNIIIQYLFIDAFSLVFTIIVILVIRKSGNVFIDQKTYLLELEKEKEQNSKLQG